MTTSSHFRRPLTRRKTQAANLAAQDTDRLADDAPQKPSFAKRIYVETHRGTVLVVGNILTYANVEKHDCIPNSYTTQSFILFFLLFKSGIIGGLHSTFALAVTAISDHDFASVGFGITSRFNVLTKDMIESQLEGALGHGSLCIVDISIRYSRMSIKQLA